ncbi:MAG: outer membrane protein, partial [Sphingobacteriales bacterium]
MKRMKPKSILLVAFVLGVANLFSQEVLSADKALEIALENNYDILIAKNTNQQSENNAAVLNSGYLPSLSVGSSASLNNAANDFTLVDGTEASL